MEMVPIDQEALLEYKKLMPKVHTGPKSLVGNLTNFLPENMSFCWQ